tara:strand:+ start:302 stop:475 length:174 start_codon:yes stop_codon:yes gene_type:complete
MIEIIAKLRKPPKIQTKNLFGVLAISRVVADRNRYPGFIIVVLASGKSVNMKVTKIP